MVIGYDGSPASKDALELAQKRAQAYNAVLYVITSLMGNTPDEAQEVREAEQLLGNARAQLKEKGFLCETHLLIRGLSPGEDLVQFAKDHEVDEVIMGVRRRSRVGKLVFGSNALYVILDAPCPVTTVK